jgi:hypothetical protein
MQISWYGRGWSWHRQSSSARLTLSVLPGGVTQGFAGSLQITTALVPGRCSTACRFRRVLFQGVVKPILLMVVHVHITMRTVISFTVSGEISPAECLAASTNLLTDHGSRLVSLP